MIKLNDYMKYCKKLLYALIFWKDYTHVDFCSKINGY